MQKTMLQNILSNMVKKPATRDFPTEVRIPEKNLRGTIEFHMENCVFCGLCSMKCPSNAIEVDRATKTLKFDLFQCVICGSCAEACKKGGVEMIAKYKSPMYSKPGMVVQTIPEAPDEETK